MASIPAHRRTEGIRQHISSSSTRHEQQHQASSLRPIITSINGNVAWIVSLPRPVPHAPAHGRGRAKAYYHILVDPWFGEEAVAGHRFILGMTLVRPPALGDTTAIVRAIGEIEAAAAALDQNPNSDSDHNRDEDEDVEVEGTRGEGVIDAIIATGAVEHAMHSSFTRFSSTIPVLATTASYESICAWKHFDSVSFLEPYDPTAPSPQRTGPPLGEHSKAGKDGWKKTTWSAAHDSTFTPSWLTVLALKVDNYNNFAVVLVMQDALSGGDDDVAVGGEAIIMAPHGIYASEKGLQALITPSPAATGAVSTASSTEEARHDSLSQQQQQQQLPVAPRLLAYLGPYKDSYTSVLHSVCGVSETLCFAQLPEDGIRYYVHNGDLPDGDLSYTGLLSYVLRDEPRTLEWGVEQLWLGKGGDGIVYKEREENGDVMKVPKEVAVGNGESFVLV